MIVDYISDVHLQHHKTTPDIFKQLTGNDTLILVGDIIDSFMNIKREDINDENSYLHNFLYDISSRFKNIIYIFGNHEFYHYEINESLIFAKEHLSEYFNNITFLENNFTYIDGVYFYGCTLWSNMNDNDSNVINLVKKEMNDYYLIKFNEEIFTPTDAYLINKKSLELLNKFLSEHKNERVVVVTHHSPSLQSINEKYKDDVIINYAYASNFENIILENPNIEYWIHGHMHDSVDYKIGNTTIISNPYGYPNEIRKKELLQIKNNYKQLIL